MKEQTKKTDTRVYTIMLVPHQGQGVRSIKIPVRYIKCSLAGIAAAVLLIFGTLFNFHYTAANATFDKAEYERLQQENGIQNQELRKLAEQTATLQENMNRLDTLDADIRRMMNTADVQQPSRAGNGLHNSHYNGQGGPGRPLQLGDISQTLKDLQQAAQVREQSLLEIKARLAEKNAQFASTPSIWPCEGEITSRFGYRSSPFGGGGDYHPGIDIANSYGTVVHATAAGVVVFAGWYSGYGNLVQIDHGQGIVSLYGHNQALLVQVGQPVKKGDAISEMGSTGFSTGPHVHYEIRVNGTAVNPASFL